ncbi:MAG: TIGR03032 family protein [Xenococcaceae cyanobacterium MO_167.B52]|nr:TIGR03032 family protein [Xenococcaceae cyanobacterium MO_167.B52]
MKHGIIKFRFHINMIPENNQNNEPMRSVHTTNFPDILQQLGISLVVSTYQAGKLIVLRADGENINTHFRMFSKPMGIAANRERMAIGCASQIWELHNMPAVANKLEPAGKHDACYIPRKLSITGDIDIHEMAWGQKDLWFVNTRFSCLCTLDSKYSFVPRWRPPFVTALTPEDRCHLNGLAMIDCKPKYVTALGQTDSAGGWRSNKANGGILMDVETKETISTGLSMPHSPRWHDNRLLVLESGNGSLGMIDLASGKLETITTLPGFTRGIDFCGSLAFIGLSQVRETAVFSGIPLTERLEARICGIWVVNIMTGETIAFLRFEDAVQEIFAVQVLLNISFPEIIDWDEKLIGNSYVLPDEALKDVPQERVSRI